jgi:hypothetical protein
MLCACCCRPPPLAHLPAQTALPVGSKVTVKGKNKGVVKFVGSTKYGPGVWVGASLVPLVQAASSQQLADVQRCWRAGVELEKAKGTHDGALDGQVPALLALRCLACRASLLPAACCCHQCVPARRHVDACIVRRGCGGWAGQRYFTCKAEHGVYALYQDVQPLKFFQKAMGALGSIGSAMSRSKSPERTDKVTDHRRAFMAWNAMDMDAEAQHHEQAATQERVEAILRASHPHAAQVALSPLPPPSHLLPPPSRAKPHGLAPLAPPAWPGPPRPLYARRRARLRLLAAAAASQQQQQQQQQQQHAEERG